MSVSQNASPAQRVGQSQPNQFTYEFTNCVQPYRSAGHSYHEGARNWIQVLLAPNVTRCLRCECHMHAMPGGGRDATVCVSARVVGVWASAQRCGGTSARRHKNITRKVSHSLVLRERGGRLMLRAWLRSLVVLAAMVAVMVVAL